MKKGAILTVILIMIIVSCAAIMCSCDLSEKDKDNNESKSYTIMYSDGDDIKSLSVKNGEIYTIAKPLPQKEGYIFMGLYDAEVGGVQYVSSSGLSVAPFSDGKDIVLYPRFKAEEYKILLDYGDAISSGINEIVVEYNGEIPYLPAYLSIADKHYMNFVGWFVNEGYYSEGIKVCNEQGMPLMRFNSSLASKCDTDKTLKLYAKFEKAKFNVDFYKPDGTLITKKTVSYGEDLSKVANGISLNGQKVLTWSLIPNGTIFNSIIDQDLQLYAVDVLKIFETKFEIKNCADNNGYNYNNQAGEADDRRRHDGFDIVSLTVNNVEKTQSGLFTIPVKDYPISMSLRVLQDLSNLPINGSEATLKDLPVDSFDGHVFETNITGKKIGKGAYYIKTTFKDGTFEESNDVNILDGKRKGESFSIRVPTVENKEISTVEVTVIYEIFTGAPGVMGIWWKEFSNWRCTTKLYFT